jgi:hypothetical protein
MEDYKPMGVLFDLKMKLQRNTDGNDESKGFPYQQGVGYLMYADLAYPISVLSQHMANLSMEHWMAIKQIF